MPYRLLAIGYGSETLPRSMDAELYHIRKNYASNKALKIEMEYSQRSNIKLSIGISENITRDIPEIEMEAHHFIYAGNGEVPLLGKWTDGNMHTEPMEFMLDITDLQKEANTSNMLKYFLKVETNGGEGRLNKLSLVNYVSSENEEINYPSENILLESDNVYYFSFLVEPDPQPKIHTEGSLVWGKETPGSTLFGSFTIENIGAPESILCWEILEYPEWGTWTFNPIAGENLKPGDEKRIVEVEVIIPDEKNIEFDGIIKIINKNSNSDYSTIPVSLSTPKNMILYQMPIFTRFLKNYPILHDVIFNS